MRKQSVFRSNAVDEATWYIFGVEKKVRDAE